MRATLALVFLAGRNGILAIVAIALFIAGGAVWLLRGPARAPLSHREGATRVLAEYLQKTAAPKSVVVISNPLSQQASRATDVSSFEKAGVAGLRNGFGGDVELKVAFPKVKGEPGSVFYDPNTRTPMSFLIKDTAFEELAREHPQADVFVSLIGLPANPLSMLATQKRYAFLLPDFRVLGDPASVRQVFKSGKVLAAVIAKPGGTVQEKAASSDYKAEFERRYILVTAQNVDELMPALLR